MGKHPAHRIASRRIASRIINHQIYYHKADHASLQKSDERPNVGHLIRLFLISSNNGEISPSKIQDCKSDLRAEKGGRGWGTLEQILAVHAARSH
jgi:hypothetical protein